MAMNREEYTDLLKKIAETGGDTDDMLEMLRRLQDDYDEREGMLKRDGETYDGENEEEAREEVETRGYNDDDVMDSDGVRWSVKYDDLRRKYRDRFFTTETKIIESQDTDVYEDSDVEISFDDLFRERGGDYEE